MLKFLTQRRRVTESQIDQFKYFPPQNPNAKLVSRCYISMLNCGDVQSIPNLIKQIANKLQPLLENKALTGYAVFNLHSSERIEDEMFDEKEILLLSNNVLPVVSVIVSFYSDKQDTVMPFIDDLENEFDLRMMSGHAH